MTRLPVSSLVSTVFRDSKLVLQGIRSFLRERRTEEHIECSISLLTAPSYDVHRSQPVLCSVSLANNTDRPLGRKLRIDIRLRASGSHPDGRYASFSKVFQLLPGVSTDLKIKYDWADHAFFVTDAAELPPDEFRRGPAAASGRYEVHAILLDSAGNPEEDLFIVQNLLA